MRWVPFTAFIKIVPSLANGKRFEIIRNAQKLSIALFEEVPNYDGGKFQLSSPSGGQQKQPDKWCCVELLRQRHRI